MKTVPGAGGKRSKVVGPSWHEEDGVIFFSVVTDGTTGRNWIKRLEHKGFRLGNDAKAILRSPDFRPTSRVRTTVAVIKGSLFEEMERTTDNVRTLALQRQFEVPDPELLCLVREKFLDKDLLAMGLFWVIGMHTPIDVEGEPRLLGADRIEDRDGYGSFMVAYRGQLNGTWDRDTGFLFKVCSRTLSLEVVR
jgi:hypothetical protein